MPGWPNRLDGYRVAVLADAHVRDEPSIRMAREAAELAVEEDPDLVLLPGDLIAYWKPCVIDMLLESFLPLSRYAGRILAIPGNHEYFNGDPDGLRPALDPLGARLLRNERVRIDGVNWVGIDSEVVGKARPLEALWQCEPSDPIVVVWHEPDAVVQLPRGPELMIAGHSHGGQFVTPWGWAPSGSRLGRRYPRGFYNSTPVPLYVSRGIGTTGPPSRLFCPAEVSILTLRPGPAGAKCVG